MKTFKKGDKVLAKLKGYPPWPAAITEVNGKKINVVFYGTGEIGTVRVEDVEYYLKNKSKCNKFKTRKTYPEAVKQIEDAIDRDGGDGDAQDQAPGAKNKGHALKRKRSSSANAPSAKKAAKPEVPHVSAENDDDDAKTDSKSEDVEMESEADGKIDEAVAEDKEKIENNEKDKEVIENEAPKDLNTNDSSASEIVNTDADKKEENDARTPEPVTKAIEVDYNCLSSTYLKNILAYAEHVKKNESTFKNMKAEPRQDNPYDVLPAFQNKAVIFIKLHPIWPIPTENLSNEYTRAIYDEQCATDALKSKELIENDKLDDCTSNIIKSTLSIEQVEDYFNNKDLDQKIDMLNRFKIEKQLVCIDTSIKNSLGLEKAETKEALEALNELKTIPFDELMLKKHPHVVDMVRRLRKYVGNTDEWKLGEKQLEEFNKDAKTIRETSEGIYENMKKSLNMNDISDNNEFWDKFSEIVKKFEQTCKDMTEAEVYVLCYEPYSRSYFLYQNHTKENFLDVDKNLNSDKENETVE